MRRLLAVSLVLGLLFVPNAPAASQTSARLGDVLEARSKWQEQRPNPGKDGSNQEAPRPTEPYLVRYVRDFDLNTNCGANHVWATVRYAEIHPTADPPEQYWTDRRECVDIPTLLRTTGHPLPPPTLVEIRDLVRRELPLPSVSTDPRTEGMTGLETSLWSDDPTLQPFDHDADPATPPRQAITVTATAGPYTVTASAYITRYRWQTGDGGDYRTDRPGTPDHPAARHTYETKGEWTLTVTTTWTGTYTWTATDGTTGSGDLGQVDRHSTTDYPVIETRAVLTD